MSVLHGNCALESATRVKVFEEVALMWLIPAYLIRGHRADIQSIDILRGNKTANQFGIGSDGGDNQAWAQRVRDLLLGCFHNAGKGNINSLFASECSAFSQSSTVGKR